MKKNKMKEKLYVWGIYFDNDSQSDFIMGNAVVALPENLGEREIREQIFNCVVENNKHKKHLFNFDRFIILNIIDI